jgi:siroheme synthase
VELIPGVTSAISAPGLAGIPLTYRGISQSFAVITGHCKEGLAQNWADYARIDTLVILMGVKNRAHIAQSLVHAGRPPDEPAAFIERATSDRQRVVITTLGEIARGRVAAENPAVLVIGNVVHVRERLVQTMEAIEVV